MSKSNYLLSMVLLLPIVPQETRESVNCYFNNFKEDLFSWCDTLLALFRWLISPGLLRLPDLGIKDYPQAS
ncbi:MAG: hypothetical protein ACRD5B_08420, partial [Nitrososphaeraceae archaeon]